MRMQRERDIEQSGPARWRNEVRRGNGYVGEEKEKEEEEAAAAAAAAEHLVVRRRGAREWTPFRADGEGHRHRLVKDPRPFGKPGQRVLKPTRRRADLLAELGRRPMCCGGDGRGGQRGLDSARQ
ncbi:hypothetical protein L1887_56593 [Cichorium endivia]|nr:hypothetical protein L1887_56593 [Cichorium endivia]